MVKIGASIMCANLLNLAEDIHNLDRAMIDYFHISSYRYPFRLINELKKEGIKVEVAINPSEDIRLVKYFLDKLDYILRMTVELGFYGQEFLKPMLDKIESVKKIY